MTTKTLKQQILDQLQDGFEYTARQLADAMMMPDKYRRISQILSELKKEGTVTTIREHCVEEEGLRTFYKIKDRTPKTAKSTEKEQKEPPKMNKEATNPLNRPQKNKPFKPAKEIIIPPTETEETAEQPDDTLYQVVIEGIVEYQNTDKDKVIEMGKRLAKSFITEAQIIAVKPQIIGTIKVTIQTDFTAA